MSPRIHKLDLGPDVIQKLLPHRAPFALVDRILAYGTSPKPILCATKYVSANEPVFRGHFPGFHLWPGVYTIEGLGQTCALLLAIGSMDAQWREQNGDESSVLDALANLELGYRLHPGYRDGLASDMRAFFGDHAPSHQLMGAVAIKMREPVFAGQQIEYTATLAHRHGDAARFRVEACVGSRLVAEGTITGFSGRLIPPPSSAQ